MKHPSKTLAFITLLALTACARAEWQEDRGNGPLAQEQNEPKPAATPPPAEPPTNFPDPWKFADCKSQTLKISVDTSKSQVSLQDFMTVTARYPLIRITKASKTKTKSVFYANAQDSAKHSCADDACAEAAGWSMIQDDFNSLNDLVLSCEGQTGPAPKPAPTPAPLDPDSGSGDGRG